MDLLCFAIKMFINFLVAQILGDASKAPSGPVEKQCENLIAKLAELPQSLESFFRKQNRASKLPARCAAGLYCLLTLAFPLTGFAPQQGVNRVSRWLCIQFPLSGFDALTAV